MLAWNYIIIFSGELIFMIGLLIFFLTGIVQRKFLGYSNFVDFCFWNAILILVLTFCRVLQLNIIKLSTFDNIFTLNTLISNVELVSLFLFLMLVLGSYDYFKNNLAPIFEFICLAFFCLLGLLILLKANNLFVLYLSIEILSLSLYVLVALRSTSIYSIEAGLKYFIFSVFLTLSLLFGIGLIYSMLGTLDFIELNLILSNSLVIKDLMIVKIGILFVICGLLLKLAIFPFHGWIADVYSGTNLVCAAFIATIPKIIFVVTLIKIIFLFIAFKFELSLILSILGCCSILVGTVIGLYQIKLLRILAFSAMVNMGHILLAVSFLSVEGIMASIYSIFIYSFLILGAFLIIIAYRTQNGWELKFIVDLPELIKGNKLLALIFCTFMLSLAGLPPFAGFCGKFFIYIAVIKQGEYFYALIVFLSSILTAVYYLRIIRFVFFSSQNSVINVQVLPISNYVSFVIVCIFIFNISLFFFQAPIVLMLFNLVLETYFI